MVTPHATPDLSDEYTAFLHRRTGLNKFIAECTPAGSRDRRRSVLEINPVLPRKLDTTLLERRNLAYAVLGGNPPDDGIVVPCGDMNALTAGLETDAVREKVDSLFPGSVIISHQSEWMSPEYLQEFILSGAAKIDSLSAGGYIFLAEQCGWIGEASKVYDVLRVIREELRSNTIIRRYTLAPELSQPFARRLAANGTPQYQTEELMKEQGADVQWRMMEEEGIPNQNYTHGHSLTFRGDRIIPLIFADELFTVRILTAEQKKQIKAKRRKDGQRKR